MNKEDIEKLQADLEQAKKERDSWKAAYDEIRKCYEARLTEVVRERDAAAGKQTEGEIT